MYAYREIDKNKQFICKKQHLPCLHLIISRRFKMPRCPPNITHVLDLPFLSCTCSEDNSIDKTTIETFNLDD